jgi:tRNA dimethylallyltransferase
MPTLIVLVGPTGVGKTAVSLQIAQHLNTPIINVDSRQLYREIPIGTAAPTTIEQYMVKHYFVGTQSINDYYSAAKFEAEALLVAQTYFEGGGKTLLASGGSMLYIDALCKGIDDIPTINAETRELLRQKLILQGLAELTKELKLLDPEYYELVDKKNPRRIVHALEICYMTGCTFSSFRKRTKKERPFNILKIGLNRDREEMYVRINQRVLEMVRNGLFDEALAVYSHRNENALNTIGYKESFLYLDGLITREEAVRQIQSHTREYMRKQLTWFKRNKDIRWFHPDNIQEILKYIDKNS